jgi:MFS family permease
MGQTPFWIYAGRFVQGAGEAPIWASAPALLGRLYPDMKGRAMGLYNAAFHMGLMLGPVLASGLLGAGLISQDAPFYIFAGLCLVGMVLVLAVVRDAAPAAAHAETANTRRTQTIRLWPVFCGVLVFGSVYGLLVSCLPVHLRAVAGLSQGQLGTFLFTAYAGIAVAQLGVGALSDRFGRTPFLVGGLALLGCSLFGFTASADTPALISFAGLGLGAGTFAVASMALASEASADHRKGRASGLYFLAWGCGYFVGPLLANTFGLVSIATALGSAAVLAACLQAWSIMSGHRVDTRGQ